MYDQSVAELIDVLPHTETLGKDDIRPLLPQGVRDTTTVAPKLTQVEALRIDVRDTHLVDAQLGVEHFHFMGMDDRKPDPTTSGKVLGQQAGVPLHATHGVRKHPVGAKYNVHWFRTRHPR